MVYSTRRFVLSFALWYFVVVFFSPFSIAIISFGEDRDNLSVFVRLSCACLVLSVSLSSLCLGRVAACDCGTPWTFLLLFFPTWPKSAQQWMIRLHRCADAQTHLSICCAQVPKGEFSYVKVNPVLNNVCCLCYLLILYWRATHENGQYAICGQRRPRSACAIAQPDQYLRSTLTETVDTVVYFDEQSMSRADCTNAHAHLDHCCQCFSPFLCICR